MPVIVTDDPEVHCTKEELERYTADYQQHYMMFADPRGIHPTRTCPQTT